MAENTQAISLGTRGVKKIDICTFSKKIYEFIYYQAQFILYKCSYFWLIISLIDFTCVHCPPVVTMKNFNTELNDKLTHSINPCIILINMNN